MSDQHEQWLYVIEHELGFVKIGIATDPEKRLGELQVGSPFNLWIRDKARPDNALTVERFLHDKFEKYHMRGEWYDIPEDDLHFEIPTSVNTLGIPNKEVEITPGRDMTYEWARLLDRLVLSLRGPRYETQIVNKLREQWREAGDLGRDDGEEDVARTPPELDELDDEREKGTVRCTTCGHYYRFTNDTCPRCGSQDAVDEEWTDYRR